MRGKVLLFRFEGISVPKNSSTFFIFSPLQSPLLLTLYLLKKSIYKYKIYK